MLQTILDNLITWQALWVAILGFTYLFSNELEDKCILGEWVLPDKWQNSSKWQKLFSYLNSTESWKAKWFLDEQGNIKKDTGHWWHFGIHPEFEERFPYSSTFLVFLTDGQHLLQFVKNAALIGAMAIVSYWLALALFIGMRAAALVKEYISWIK